jgi:hypothetical protein
MKTNKNEKTMIPEHNHNNVLVMNPNTKELYFVCIKDGCGQIEKLEKK